MSREILIDNFDRDLLLEFQNLASVARVWPNNDFYVDIDFDVATQYNSGGTRIFQVWNENGSEVIDQSPMLEDENRRLAYPPRPATNKPYFYNLVDHYPARAIFQMIDTQWGWAGKQQEREATKKSKSMVVQLLVVRERTSLDHSLNLLLNWMLNIAAILPVLTFFIVYFTIGKGMQPLRDLTTKVSAIRCSEEKLPTSDHWPTEISPVTDTLNALLKRLDLTLQRERRFTADAAHELRSPLAELRTATDIALRASDNKERLLIAVRQANELSHSMANLVNSMLLLARFESGMSTLDISTVNLVEILEAQYQRIQSLAKKRQITLITEAPTVLTTASDKGLLEIIISVLLTNAAEYAPLNSIVKIILLTTDNGFTLITENLAPDLAEDDLDKLFHPFWRKGKSRGEKDHYGLGLSIVQEAANCLKLAVNTDLSEDKRLHICVTSN
ncbi:MAG: HAMP domain-containing sensor histidine kinase [Candidatus Thiodiazotropha sp.]